jgi:uncharacterized membrane protein
VYSRRAGFVLLVLALIPLALSVAVYSRLPETMASHWGMSGEADGFTGRAKGALTVPIITLALWSIFAILPRIAPARPEFGSRGRFVAQFVGVLFLFFGMIHAQLLLWNMGTEIRFGVTVPVGLGVLFIAIGRMLGHVEPNWAVGIRTYWTLKHPVVWVRTHERAALLFKILGLIYVAAAFFRDYVLLFILLPAVFLALYLPAYSFLLYQRIQGLRRRD